MYIEPDTRNNYVTNFMQIISPFKQSLTILIPGSLMLKISPDKFHSYGKKFLGFGFIKYWFNNFCKLIKIL